jgi:nucleoid-associated protein YgaU
MAALSRGLRRLLVIVFLAFAAVGSYYAWTGPDGAASADRAPLVVVESSEPVASSASSESGRIRDDTPVRPASTALADVVTVSNLEAPVAAAPPVVAFAESDPPVPDIIEILPPRAAASFESDDEPTTTEETSGSPAGTELPSARRHRIQSGETLSAIAERFYGDASLWRRIADANPALDIDRLAIGTEIVLPAVETCSIPETLEPSAPAAARVHVVVEGETLSSIAASLYGDSAQWRRLYEANRSTIGADPGAIRVGMRLSVPPVE